MRQVENRASVEIGDPAGIVPRTHHRHAARDLDGRELHEIAAFDDLAPDPFEKVQALIGAPRAGQHHALGAVGHDPLEPPVRGADRKRAVHQGLVVISREGGDPGRAHPAERLRRESAKIYQFPTGGRAALGSRRDEAKLVENFAASRTAKVAPGGAWYHEEAV